MFAKVELDHRSEVLAELHQANATFEFTDFKLADQSGEEGSKVRKIFLRDTPRTVDYEKNIQVFLRA